MLLVSACLAGEKCRYDGNSNLIPALRALVEAGRAIPVCPEVLGGLPTPRPPSELQPDGRVCNVLGADVSAEYRRGAALALAACRSRGCCCAIMKARSPACGKGVIYDGSFSHVRVPGNGVAAALLLQNGVPVFTEDELEQALKLERMEQANAGNDFQTQRPSGTEAV